MSKNGKNGSSRRFAAQQGTAAVEFALVALVLFGFIFATIEVSRMIYLWSTLAHVTNRAARGAAMQHPSAAPGELWRAMFLAGPEGKLPLGGGIAARHLRIDYLKFDASVVPTTSVPACLALNTLNCLNDPQADNCVRFVQVRVCDPDSPGCAPVRFRPIVPFPDVAAVRLPRFTAIAPVETMGTPGACSS